MPRGPMKKAANPDSIVLDVPKIETGRVQVCILGDTPLFFNRVNQKAIRELLLPAGRKSEATKAANLKHDPLWEYQQSAYKNPRGEAHWPTRLKFPGDGFKACVADAALDMPGVAKTAVERLLSPVDRSVCIYGIPALSMAIVRNSDIGRTPDIRTRAVVKRWAAMLTFSFIRPRLNENSVFALIAAAGRINGIGDWRQQKGAGNNGTFSLVDPDHVEFREIIATGGVEAQDAALDNPGFFDEESEELLAWFNEEIKKRGRVKDLKGWADEDLAEAAD